MHDALTLARIQFAFTIAFHIVLPALSIGLASYLAVLEALWLRTGRAVYMTLFRYWIRVFALSFAMGVVSGVVLSYQIGTNWSVFAERTGPVIGPLMGYEVLTAFFLEAGFLGVMLFGVDRVGRGIHFFATLMVAVGTLVSAFWILAVNSWMQTPAGHGIDAAGNFYPVDWWAIVFNPSFPYRLVHMVLAAYLTTALVVAAAAGWHLLRRREPGEAEAVRTMLTMAVGMLAVTAPLQILAGDMHGLNTLEHQPAKIAALEGRFETMAGAPLALFGWPDMKAAALRYAVEVPRLGSLVLTHEWDGVVPGLDRFAREDWPNATVIFFTFRLMVGLGVLMLALGIWGVIARLRGTLATSRGLHRFALAMGPAGFVAIIAGWITTEVGRQPWTVYGLLRTADSVSPIAAPGVAGSLMAFVAVYFIVFGAGIAYAMKLMSAPVAGDMGGGAGPLPTRAAGITPGPALASKQGGPAPRGGDGG